MKSAGLGERIRQGVAAVTADVEAEVRSIIEHARPELVLPVREKLSMPLARIGIQIPLLGSGEVGSDLSFKIAIIGRFNTGKSTFLSALAADTACEQLLPAGDSPCTVIPTFLMPGTQGVQVFMVLKQSATAGAAPLRQLISVEDLKRLHLHPYEDSVPDPFPEIERIEIEGALPAHLEHVVLIDTLGADDRPAHTDRTLGVAAGADAIIALLRQDMGSIATPDEINFLRLAAPPRERGGKKVFHVINEFVAYERCDEDDEDLWCRLLAETGRAGAYVPGRKLEEGDVFFVNARKAKEGRLGGKPELVAQSGIELAETRIARFLLGEGLQAKLEPVLGDLIEVGRALESDVRAEVRAMRQRSVRARAAAAAVAAPVVNLNEALSGLKRETLQTSQTILSSIKSSFEAALMSVVTDAQLALDGLKPASLSTWGGKLRHLVSKSRATTEVQDVIAQTIQTRMSAWAIDASAVNTPRDIFDSEHRSLVDIIAQRLVEVDMALDSARRQLLEDEAQAAGDTFQVRMDSWRAKLDAMLKNVVSVQLGRMEFADEYGKSAFGGVIAGALMKIGLIPVAQPALTHLALWLGAAKATAVGISAAAVLPLTIAASVAGALFMNRNAADRVKQKSMKELTGRLGTMTKTAWDSLDKILSDSLTTLRRKFDEQIDAVIVANRSSLEEIQRQANATAEQMQELIAARDRDAETIATAVERLDSLFQSTGADNAGQ